MTGRSLHGPVAVHSLESLRSTINMEIISDQSTCLLSYVPGQLSFDLLSDHSNLHCLASYLKEKIDIMRYEHKYL